MTTNLTETMFVEDLKEIPVFDELVSLQTIGDCFYSSSEIHQRQKVHQIMKENGLYGLATAKGFGGAGINFSQLFNAFEHAGRSLLPSPFFSANFAAILINNLASDAAKSRLLPELSAGNLSASIIFDFAKPWFETIFTSKSEANSVDINCTAVLDLANADICLLPVKGNNGIDLYLINSERIIPNSKPFEGIDPTFSLSSISIKKFALEIDKINEKPIQEDDFIKNFLMPITLLYSASMAGVSYRCINNLVEYANSRKIDDKPISSFQAVSHRIVDNYVDLEKFYSLLVNTRSRFELGYDIKTEVSMAKAAGSQALLKAAQNSVQTHGAKAFQWQYEVNFFFRRALLSRRLFGTSNAHYNKISQIILEQIKTKEKVEAGFGNDGEVVSPFVH